MRPARGRTWTRGGPATSASSSTRSPTGPRRENALIAPVTTITDLRHAPAPALAAAYHERWEHETGNAQLKTYLRGPGRVLRSKSPDLIRQEISGYLLTHYAISALICTAATRPASTLTGSISSGPSASSAAGSTARLFPPDQREHVLAYVITAITNPRHLNTRRERTYPRVVKPARHNSYPVRTPPARHPARRPRHQKTRQPRPDQGKDQHRRLTKIS